MLSKLFKRRNPLAAARPDKRLKAIAALTPEKAARYREQLHDCVRGDTNPQVRHAALAWVEDQALLVALLDDASIARAAAARLAALGAASDHPAVREARMRAVSSGEEAVQVARDATAPKALAALFMTCPEAYRQALLPQVRQLGEAGLAALERHSRDHNKQVNRAARSELETLRSAGDRASALRERAEELMDALARDAVPVPDRARQLQRALADCIQGVQKQADTLTRYGLEAPNVQRWQDAIATAETAVAALESESSGFDALVAEFQAMDERMVAGEFDDSLREAWQGFQDDWLARAQNAQPSKQQNAVFEAVRAHYQELASAVERWQGNAIRSVDIPPETQDWPQSADALHGVWKQQRDAQRTKKELRRKLGAIAWPPWAALPQALQSAVDNIEHLDGFSHRVAEHQQVLKKELSNQIEATGGYVEQGQLQPAQSALSEARRIARSLPEGMVRNHRRALSTAAARMHELQGWHAFATVAKRKELVQNMEALAAEELTNAKDRTDKIKMLRAEWNALGRVSGPGARGLHAQFNRLAEQAFEPCRAHFSEQAELRKRNFSERQRICEQLEEYLDAIDWASADMRAAEKIMRVARSEWRAHYPVDRRDAKKLDARFEALQKRIFTRVKREWDANLAAKRVIVAEAEKLAVGSANMGEKIRQAKALQQRWREIGMTPRKLDQKLWRLFREQCDLIFAARESNRRQAASHLKSTVEQAETICATLRDELANADPSTANRRILARLRAQFNAVVLPERLERSMRKRFDDIARNYNQLILAGELRALRNQLEQLKVWDMEVSSAEQEGRPVTPPTPAFEGRTADAEEPLPDLRRLAIEAELLAGVQSPPADRQLRLEIQVNALNQGMGRRAPDKEPTELAEVWCNLGPKSAASDTLRDRFFTALLKLASA